MFPPLPLITYSISHKCSASMFMAVFSYQTTPCHIPYDDKRDAHSHEKFKSQINQNVLTKHPQNNKSLTSQYSFKFLGTLIPGTSNFIN